MGDSSDNAVGATLVFLVEKAQEFGLREFLLIGGNAVIAYGVPRFTRDVDFVIPERVRQDWRVFLEAVGIPFIHGTDAFLQFQDSEGKRPRVDLMVVNESTWQKLSKNANILELDENIAAEIAAPDHLIAMKLSACQSPHRRTDAVDWRDVVELTIRMGFDPEKDREFAELVLRYGNEALLSELIDEVVARKNAGK